MRRFFKWFGIAFGALVLLLTLAAINIIWFRPFSIDIFYEKAFLGYAFKSPQTLSALRMLEGIGVRSHNAKLDDISPASAEKFRSQIKADFATLRSYDRSALDGQKALSFDVMEYFLKQQVDGHDFMAHDYPVNQISGVQSQFPNFMVSTHHLGDEQDCRHYIERLRQTGMYFDQLLEDLALRESKDITPPRFAVSKALSEMRGFIGTPAVENILYTSFAERAEKMDATDKNACQTLAADVETAVESQVYPAYRKLIAYMDGLLVKADSDHGVWKLPRGDEYYAYKLREHTTTDITPGEVHQLGLDEVARIAAEMDTILQAQGYTDGTVGERMQNLGAQTQFLYPNDDNGRAQILQDFQHIIDEISAGMEPMFDLAIEAGVEVRRVPPFSEDGAPAAYYQGPAPDGSRPGVFYANLRDLKEHPRFAMRTLAYHEAVPGHHYQTTVQLELRDVPMFRRFLGFTAYSEGWALYAERLAWEQGYQDDPYDNLGRLQDEMLRAVRLVVDSGVHYKRWTREQAIDYMVDHTGRPRSDATTEIERYMVWPGQATAYKIGMLKILELRARAQAALGEQFDIRDFHRVVLSNGDIPLFLLEREVDKYIAGAKS